MYHFLISLGSTFSSFRLPQPVLKSEMFGFYKKKRKVVGNMTMNDLLEKKPTDFQGALSRRVFM